VNDKTKNFKKKQQTNILRNENLTEKLKITHRCCRSLFLLIRWSEKQKRQWFFILEAQ